MLTVERFKGVKDLGKMRPRLEFHRQKCERSSGRSNGGPRRRLLAADGSSYLRGSVEGPGKIGAMAGISA